jgi:hypothetical protein
MGRDESDSWKEWSKYVLMELERQSDVLKELSKKDEALEKHFGEVEKTIAVVGLKVGFLCAVLSIAVTLLGKYLLQ